jgi:integrase
MVPTECKPEGRVMKGHVRRRGKASWAVILDLGRDAAGKRRQKWHSVKGTRKEAEHELARLLNELRVGEYVESTKMPLREYLERWLRDYAKPRVSPKTYERYKQIVDRSLAPALGDHVLAKLRPLHIQEFYANALQTGRKDGHGGLSAQTVLHLHRLLHKALSQAVRWQLLARNPATAVEPPRPQREQMRALDEKETATLIKSLEGKQLYLPTVLAVAGGLRRGEMLALRWQDVDLGTGLAVICRSLEQTKEGLRFKTPKTERGRRTVVLPGFALEQLRSHKAQQAARRLATGPAYSDNDLICAREDGTPWPPDAFSTAFAKYVRGCKLAHFRFHDLRHTHATQLLRQGVHPKIVSERLGHSNIAITLDTYSHVLPGMQEDAMTVFDASLRLSLTSGRHTSDK